MVTAPSFSHAEAAALREAAGNHAAIGLHLTLTAPFSPHAHGFAPLRHGVFLPLASMARRALSRSLTAGAARRRNCRPVRGVPRRVRPRAGLRRRPPAHPCVSASERGAAARHQARRAARLAAPMRPRGAPAIPSRRRLFSMRLSRRFRRLAAEHGLRTNPAFAGTYAFRARADYARTFSKIPRWPARRRRRHVPPGQGRRRTDAARSAHRFARARIRVFSRETIFRNCSPSTA